MHAVLIHNPTAGTGSHAAKALEALLKEAGVHAPQQVVLRDTFLEPELVEQLAPDPAFAVPSSPRPRC